MQQNKVDFLPHSQRVKYVGAIIPFINLFIIPFIVYSATHKLPVVILCCLNPMIGVMFLKLSTRFSKQALLKTLPLFINGINIFFICWLSGSTAPSFLIGIPYIGACSLIFSNLRNLIIAVCGALFAITLGSYLAGKNLNEMVINLGLLLCYSFMLIRVLHFTILQGKEIMMAHQEIEKQKQLIEEKSKEVEQKNKDIIDSIHYAKRIQRSLLPTEKYIERVLKENEKS